MSCPARCDISNFDPAIGWSQNRLPDAGRQRQRLFEPADEGQYHQEMQEIIGGTESAQDQPSSFGRLTASENEKKAVSHQYPEEKFEDRPEASRADRARIEPRHHKQYQNRCGHGGYAKQLVRNGFQDGVIRQKVPFGHDFCRRHARISGDRVVGVEQSARLIENEPSKYDQENRKAQQILDRVVGMERDCVRRFLSIDAVWIVGAEPVERDKVQEYNRDY